MSNFIGIRHVGLASRDPVAAARFYQEVMGMTIVAQTPANSPVGVMAFLSRHPGGDEHHDLALFSNPTFAYTAFRVEDLDDFLAFYHEVKDKGIPIKYAYNHGPRLSFYIDDPDGHNLDIYWPTHLTNVPPDYPGKMLDLDRSKEEILKEVELTVEQIKQGVSVWNADQGSANQWNQSQGNANQWNANQWNMGDWNKQVIEEFRANGGKVGRLPTPVLLITTTGRKSGKPYTTPVGYMIDSDRLIVVPSSVKADWYLNVLANPQVKVEVGTESFTATVTPVEGEQKAIFLQRARKIAEAAATAWRPPEAGDMADHVPEDSPVVALQRVR